MFKLQWMPSWADCRASGFERRGIARLINVICIMLTKFNLIKIYHSEGACLGLFCAIKAWVIHVLIKKQQIPIYFSQFCKKVIETVLKM
ncbi:hypothetical protein P4H83_17330 [Paenibacillus favisporus]|uniref:hypothetical protein n=1 Tax=Paenibacillus favisporus TaxID=221028 RepID=UPI002DBDE94D|nr:hypothetical protein [Paenibacillus favisporus]MEC0176639.1 hypothetical protein [Paenibacillus favisporus]